MQKAQNFYYSSFVVLGAHLVLIFSLDNLIKNEYNELSGPPN
jgi:hypothetical protein